MKDYELLNEFKPDEKFKRVSFLMPKELHDRYVRLIPWGVRGRFFVKVLETALSEIEDIGPAALGGLLMGEFEMLHKREAK